MKKQILILLTFLFIVCMVVPGAPKKEKSRVELSTCSGNAIKKNEIRYGVFEVITGHHLLFMN